MRGMATFACFASFSHRTQCFVLCVFVVVVIFLNLTSYSLYIYIYVSYYVSQTMRGLALPLHTPSRNPGPPWIGVPEDDREGGSRIIRSIYFSI